MVRQVTSEFDAVSSLCRHESHLKGRRTGWKAVPINCQPVPLGEVEEHCRIAARGNDPPRRGIRLEPVLSEKLLPLCAVHAILSIQDVVGPAVGIERGRRRSKLLKPASGFLTTFAVAGGGQNRPAEQLQFHLAASTYRREMFVLFPVHCGAVCENRSCAIILAHSIRSQPVSERQFGCRPACVVE